MKQPKLLNLDNLVSVEKVVTIDGVEHAMREITVQEFINKAAEARASKDEALSVDQQVEKAVEMIHDAFPTLSPERLRKMSIRQLTVLIDFVVKAPEQIEAETQAAQGNG